MKIAIEAQRIFRTNKHGMDFVALESIRELQKIDHENEYFIFVTPGEDRCLEESENVHIIELKCPTYPLWEQVALPRAVKKIMPDLLHCTSNTAPLQCPVPLILTLHDIIYLEKRHSSSFTWYQEMGWFYRRMVVPRVLANCEKIITVSQFERERILDVLHLPEEQLVAVYNGFNSHFHVQPKAPEITRKYIDADNYLFFLGNTDPKKNTPRVLKAYSDYLKQSTQKLPLLIADLKGDVIDQILEEESVQFRIADMSSGKAVDDGYRGVHVYYQKSGKYYPIEIQFNTLFDRQLNNWLHDYLYKKDYPIETGRILREKYESGLIRNEHEFKEVLNNVLSGSERS